MGAMTTQPVQERRIDQIDLDALMSAPGPLMYPSWVTGEQEDELDAKVISLRLAANSASNDPPVEDLPL